MRLQVPTPLVVVLVVAALVVLVGLGSWQLARYQYKQDLTDERAASIAETPISAIDASALAEDELEYRRLALEGEWDYERLQVIANVLRFGARGEEVVVPLVPAGGGPAVLVNRGWYPVDERDQVLSGLASGDANLEGLVLTGGGPRASQTAEGAWTRFDVASMGAVLPYPVEPWRVIAGELVEEWPRQAPDARPVTGFEGLYERDAAPRLRADVVRHCRSARAHGCCTVAKERARPGRGCAGPRRCYPRGGERRRW